MSKRTIGIILLIVGLLLFLQHSPYNLEFIPYKDLLWPLAMAVFGLYLINRKNYQGGLVIFYIGVCYSLYYGGWKPIAPFINNAYFWPTAIMVLGIGFIVQSQRGR
ncbi:MAG: hypothetical protein GX046_03600 [Tissierellia bacterium]|jgi:hypothetical protein|nr:hypothetical protein [Tissierellia bacterium]